MIEPSFEIRSTTRDEMSRTVASIVEAFITDPLTRFACPSPHEYFYAMPLVIPEFAGRSFEHGTAYIFADFCAAALWLPPGVYPDGEALERVLRETVRPERLHALLGTFEEMDKWHPDEPHWYLPLIGVDPYLWNRGLDSALMRHVLARCDQEGVPAYLESSNPRNIPLYERHGFEVMGEIQAGAASVVTIEIIEEALIRARERIQRAGVNMTLVNGDVTMLRDAGIGTGFRLILDTGTFHDFDTARQHAMGREIDAIAAPDATVLLLVWPKRIRPLIRGATRDEIEPAFPGWSITHVEPSHFRLPKIMEMIVRPDEHWYRLCRA